MKRVLSGQNVNGGPLRADRRTALVLLNMGGPDNLEAVEPFLFNLFSDRSLIALPGGALLQKPLARMLARRRAEKSREHYRRIGGKSPLADWTLRQARGLAEALGGSWSVEVVMRYWPPQAGEVLRRMRGEGVRQALVLPLYPQYAGATSGSSIADFRQAAASLFPELAYHIIDHWYDWPGYLDALAARIGEGLQRLPENLRAQAPVLFSAHALPQKVIDRGDPYLGQTLATVRGVMQRLGERPWHLGFQSRSGPVKWLQPGIETVLKDLAAAGHTAVLMVPLSFVSDHVETLYEIDQVYRQKAGELGIVHFARSPSLNDHPDFIRALAGLVVQRFGDLSQ